MKAFTFAIFLTLAVAFAAASEDTEIDDALLGHLDADTEDVTDLESQVKTSWGSRRAKRYITRKHYKCHYNQNWVNGLKYSQKVIKASSRRAAAQMCVNDCAKRKGCTGFFYQKHKNGHQICGFYSSKIGAGTWHGHAEGAVCRHYKTTRHEVKGQVAEAEEFLADAKAPETEAEDAASEEVTDLESQEKTSWGSRRAKRYITRKHYKCHYNQNWVNGLKYSQKVIKASSRRAAAQMCVNDCAKRYITRKHYKCHYNQNW